MIEELYTKYHQELVGWCRHMTGDLHTAEELVHEAFLRAMLHEDVLAALQEPQRRSWIYRTIKNLYVDRIRHSSRECVSQELPQQSSYPEEIISLEWEQLLEALPDLEGVIFSLRYLQGYNSSQIGAILSLAPGTVRAKLSSARQHLKKALS